MAVLALLQDEDLEEGQDHERLMSALGSTAGEYVGYRDTAQATVERVARRPNLEAKSAAGG
jgi:hypothetical protein